MCPWKETWRTDLPVLSLSAFVDPNICELIAGQVEQDFCHSFKHLSPLTSHYFLNTGVRRQVRTEKKKKKKVHLSLSRKANLSSKVLWFKVSHSC